MSVDCGQGIFADIIATCDTVGNGGNEVKAWILNRTNVTLTFDTTTKNIITGAVNASGERAYTLTGMLKTIDSGFDRSVEEGLPDRFSHYIGFGHYSFDAASGLSVDNLKDVIVIVESRDKTDDGDGVFRVYGALYGLDVTSDTHRANTNKGARTLELGSRDGDNEPYSYYVFYDTDYATTKAAIEALETEGT